MTKVMFIVYMNVKYLGECKEMLLISLSFFVILLFTTHVYNHTHLDDKKNLKKMSCSFLLFPHN